MGVLSKFIGVLSGGDTLKISEQLLFDKVIGVRGVVPGVGTSTFVQNIAIALSENTNCTVCVLDMNCLYPTQYSMLCYSDDNNNKNKKDIFDFADDVSEIVQTTKYKNVYLAGFKDRTVIDMLSSKDSDATLNQIIGSLKSYFDVILIDLSYELTNMNVQAGVKCNRIISVADQSLKCMVNLQKSLNTCATLAIPFSKVNTVVLNKVAPNLVTDTEGVLASSGLDVLCTVHFSMDVLKAGVSGKRVYSKTTTNDGLKEFNCAIDDIVNYILHPTPLMVDAETTHTDAMQNNNDSGDECADTVLNNSGSDIDTEDYGELNNDKDVCEDEIDL